MSDYRARLFDEHGQLKQRIDKLKDFIVSDKYESLPEIDRIDLKEQLKWMNGYFNILSKRVSRQCGNT